jgi:4-amino-4-deoxy-L-arabinose transferase-like glycosyltransferase
MRRIQPPLEAKISKPKRPDPESIFFPLPHAQRAQIDRVMHSRLILAAVGILLLAGFLRIWALGDVPPGVWYDEAAYAIDAQAVERDSFPIYFTGNQGREPLFIYLQAIALELFGLNPLGLRFVPVAAGMLTVALTFPLAHAMFGGRVALLSVALVALSGWHAVLSRVAMRATMTPLMVAAVAGVMWLAFRRRSPLLMAVAGALLGLSFYSYTAARAMPIWLAVFFSIWLLIPRWRPGISASHAVAMILAFWVTAGIVAAPLGYYFIQNPQDFANRSAQVVTVPVEMQLVPGQNGDPRSIDDAPRWGGPVENILRTLGMFLVSGDTNARHNLLGRPVFDPLTAIAFVAGIITIVARLLKPEHAFLALWLFVMLLPGALTGESPHMLRTAGILPGIYIFAAIGLVRLISLAGQLGNGRVPGLNAGVTAVTVLIVWTAVRTATGVLGEWPQHPETIKAFEADYQVATQLIRTKHSDEMAVVSTRMYRGEPASGMLFVAPKSGQDIRYFSGAECLLVPNGSGGVLYILAGDAHSRFARHVLAESGAPPSVLLQHNDISVIGHRLTPLELENFGPSRLLQARIGDLFTVLGYDIPRRVNVGDPMYVTVHLQLQRPVDLANSWQFFGHMLDEKGQPTPFRSHIDICLPSDSGLQGDRLAIQIPFWETHMVPVGTYSLAFGLWDKATDIRQPTFDGSDRPLGSSLTLGPFRFGNGGVSTPPDSLTLSREVHVGDAIRLLGYEIASTEPQPGGRVRASIYWQMTGSPDEDYTVFLQLLDSKNRVIAQRDNYPQNGSYPTSLWGDGEIVQDEYLLHLSDDIGDSPHRLIVGMYRLADGKRLVMRDSDGRSVGDSFQLFP